MTNTEKAAKARLDIALALAAKGFHFFRTARGYSRALEDDWQKNATTDGERIRDWLSDDQAQLVMVAKKGHGIALDIDDWLACCALGFDKKWISGMFRVGTPSGRGFHIYIPWDDAFDAIGNKDVYGQDDPSRPIAELKANNTSVCAPGGVRWESPDGKKCAGVYRPVGGRIIRCPDAPALAAWFAEHGKPTGTHGYTGKAEKWRFHPSFETADFLDWNMSALADGDEAEGMHEGSHDLVLAECPLCDAPARPNSTPTNFVTKFRFSGTGYAFLCFHCDVMSKDAFEAGMAERYPDWTAWNKPIYRHDDEKLFLGDVEKVWAVKPDGAVGETKGGKEGETMEGTGMDGQAYSALHQVVKAELTAEAEDGETADEGTATPPQAETPQADGPGEETLVEGEVKAAEAPQDEAEDTPDDGKDIILAEREGRDGNDDPCTLTLVGVKASDIVPVRLEWLWEQRIPATKITWLAGMQDNGKSLVLLDIIARITTGRDWPDGEKNTMGPRMAILAAAEDTPNDTIVPRLMAAGADLDRVIILHFVKSKKGDKATRLRIGLDRDTLLLKDALEKYPDAVMIAFDPITGYFGKANPNKNEEIQPVLEAVNRVCDARKVAFVAICHFNKRSDVNSLQKIIGGSSVAGVSRAAWSFSRDPDDKETFRMARIKGNLSKKRSGMMFHTVDKSIALPDGKDTVLPVIEWAGECDEDADQLMAQDREKARNGGGTATDRAMAWLKERLKGGGAGSTVMFEEAKAAGISRNSLFRAKEKDNETVLARCRRMGDGWYWSLKSPSGGASRDTAILDEMMKGEVLSGQGAKQAG